ncbi:MAG: putative bifunctional diguanylate cyclase/phosphodiesterase [bacterium]
MHAKRNSKQVAVFFVDLDGFKRINDNQGHAAGDRFLQLVAERLKNGIRESDTVARLGGDEFTVILKDLKSSEDATNVARKVLSILAEPFVLNEESFLLTASIGISVYPFDGDDCEAIIKKADSAMYHAKAQGKNNFQLFNSSLRSRALSDLSMEVQLRKALDKNQLCVHYQPQVSLLTGKIVGVEALVRLQNPEFGTVLPGKFIPVAEETGLIVPLGEWVLRTACLQSKALQELGFEDVPVAINLSARQFREHGLTEAISQVLRDTGLPAHYLRLEISETYAMQNMKYTIATLTELKELGVQIVLDDFGTGYSSLSYLKRFPIDILKIDRSFLKEVPTNKQDAAIITAIIALTRSLGMSVIAEGVENKDQIDFLQSVDCNDMQGFYFSKPLPFDELQKSLSSFQVREPVGDLVPLLVVE